MKNNKLRLALTLIAVLVLGIVLAGLSVYFYNTNTAYRELFSGSATGLGTVGPESEESLAQRVAFTGKVSMWIFIFITFLQMAALWVGYAVVSSIRNSDDPVKLKLRSLDNAEVFFDVPLYFGLFGTVSAFLVMTFSPQSSRLIAYSSTLIGIIFSLLLRLILQYPLRRQLVRQDALEDMCTGENK
jgi:hypothetical protein